MRGGAVGGFTLIELLLALALLALVAGLMQGTYTGAVRSRDRASAETARIHAAAVVLDRLADELAGAFVSEARGEITGLSAAPDADGNTVLVFTARPVPIPGVRAGGLAEVGYFVETRDDGVPRLYRREDPDPDEDWDEGGRPYPVLEGVSRFVVRCFDGEAWKDEWDSRGREEEPVLPLAVSIEVAWKEGEGPERVLRTATPIYAEAKAP